MPHRPPSHGALLQAPDCFTSRLRLHEYVDGELDASPASIAVRSVVQMHLMRCARCARLERQLRRQREMLGDFARRTADLDTERASDALRARVRNLLAG